MNRRTFLEGSLTVLLIPSMLTACAGGDDGGTDDEAGTDSGGGNDSGSSDTGSGGDTGGNGDTGTACSVANDASGPSESHGHVITIPAADLEAGSGGTYTSSGGTHDHTVTLSAQDISDLVNNCTVTVSSNDSHPHDWVLTLT